MRTPPLLMAAALVFWSWQTGYWVLGLVMALLLESSRVINRRFDLSPRDFYRLADLTAVLFALMLVYRYVLNAAEGSPARWLPLAMFPLLLAQAYADAGGVDLGAISYTVRQKEKKGRLKQRRLVDVSYPAFGLTLLAASAANQRGIAFFAGLFVLIAWALWPVKSRRFSRPAWIAALLIAGGMGFAGQAGLLQLHGVVEKQAVEWLTRWMQDRRDPFRQATAIGDIGRLKLSERVVLRVEAKDEFNGLLHQAAYTVYRRGRWLAASTHFRPISPAGRGDSWPLLKEADGSASMTVYGSLNDGRAVLSLPGGAARLEGLPVVRMERSQFGVVRVEEGPDLIGYQALYTPGAVFMAHPGEDDRALPPDQEALFRGLADDLGLESLAPAERVDAVKRFFQSNFTYSLNLSGPGLGRNPLAHFLLTSRSGHCEYFAASAVLLLRAAGLPARYVTGYLADEYSALEGLHLVRARHAHAWAAVFVNGRWRNVDATPSVWVRMEADNASAWQKAFDLWRFAAFRFAKWRHGERSAGLPAWAVWLVPPLTLLLIYRVFSQRKARAVGREDDRPREGRSPPGGDSPYYRVEEAFKAAGYQRLAHETQAEWAARLKKAGVDPTALADLEGLIQLHYRLRFRPGRAAGEVENALREGVDDWLGRHHAAPCSTEHNDGL